MVYALDMLERAGLLRQIRKALGRSPVVALLGPRQSGKTTLAREIVPPDSENYFDLEDPMGLARLEQPKSALEVLSKIVVIDEIQRKTDLFPILRVLADRKPSQARFLILGSASPELLKGSSETLAGRLETIPISGFTLQEVGPAKMERHWLRGGFPVSFLARSDSDSFAWRKNFVQTILERDLPMLGVQFPSPMLFRFWSMLSHYHGQTWNGAEMARSLGVSEPTIKRYVDFLEGLYLIRQLKPWHSNLGKRLVKSPKMYIRDSGLLHFLFGISNRRSLFLHPKMGASWEGYLLEEVLKTIPHEDAFFWATHNRAEMDLVLLQKGRLIGFECKRTDAPGITPSIRNAMKDLGLEKVFIISRGEKMISLAERITVLPIQLLQKTRLAGL